MADVNVKLKKKENINVKLKPAQSIKVGTSNVYVFDKSMLDKTFVFEQAIATDTWHIQHTLNKRASCVAVDSAGEVQIPDKIKYISDNEIIATFLAPFAGKAYLN